MAEKTKGASVIEDYVYGQNLTIPAPSPQSGGSVTDRIQGLSTGGGSNAPTYGTVPYTPTARIMVPNLWRSAESKDEKDKFIYIMPDKVDSYIDYLKVNQAKWWNDERKRLAMTDSQFKSAIKTSAGWIENGMVANTGNSLFANLGAAAAASASGSTGGGSGGTTTQATTYGEQAARNIGNNAWVNELGREMTDKEAKAFAKALNAASRKNPSVYSQGEQKVGFSPEQFTQDYARSQEGWAERQVGINFMEVLDRAISQPTQMESILAGGE